jgi:hypothetical protein
MVLTCVASHPVVLHSVPRGNALRCWFGCCFVLKWKQANKESKTWDKFVMPQVRWLAP